ncbi:hypothetical protein TNCV_3087791 [Trichonephila clavipes]|uniref:Uncharacterized protein n=1 Tax=Trichonephila clavipes TaxID=2585209 RepID=A0A8X6RH63_TRICX|nr:hypothetical protein TNCV_3087791 [Trichonephila clavipes]
MMLPASWIGCLSYRMSSSQSRQFQITKEVGTRRRARIPILAVPERLRGLSSVILCSLLDFMDCYHSPRGINSTGEETSEEANRFICHVHVGL